MEHVLDTEAETAGTTSVSAPDTQTCNAQSSDHETPASTDTTAEESLVKEIKLTYIEP